MNENFCRSIAEAVSFKKVVIYGAGELGATMLNIMDCLGKEVIFFLDKNPNKQETGFCGYQVKAPEEILYEDMSETIVVAAIGAKKEVEDILIDFGLRKGIEFINGAAMRYLLCDSVDPFLGYCRSTDMNGFKIMGEDGGKKNIICLGGSTTDYSLHGIKSWPEYLSELFKDDSINVLNGGVIGYSSSQELLKLIRDGLELKPSLVISYSGVNDLGRIPIMECEYLHNVWKNMQLGNNFASRQLSDEVSVSCEKKSQLDSAEYWYRNEIIMCSICYGFSIPFLGILQPSIYTKNIEQCSLYARRAYNLDKNQEYTKKQYSKAKKLVNTQNEKFILDFTNLFDEYDDVYVDTCHVFEEGNKIIAEAIYQVIKERHIFDI